MEDMAEQTFVAESDSRVSKKSVCSHTSARRTVSRTTQRCRTASLSLQLGNTLHELNTNKREFPTPFDKTKPVMAIESQQLVREEQSRIHASLMRCKPRTCNELRLLLISKMLFVVLTNTHEKILVAEKRSPHLAPIFRDLVTPLLPSLRKWMPRQQPRLHFWLRLRLWTTPANTHHRA